MSRLSVNLPPKLKAQIEERVASGQYGSAEQYLGELLRRDHSRSRQQAIEAMLLRRLNKENAVEMDAGDFGRIRRKVLRRIRNAKNS